MTFQITSNSTACSPACSCYWQRKHKSFVLSFRCARSSLVTDGYPYKKQPVMWKAIPRHDVIMAIPCWSLRSHFYRSNIWPLPARHRGGTDSIYRHSHSAHGHSLLASRHPKTIFASERFRRSRHIAIIQVTKFVSLHIVSYQRFKRCVHRTFKRQPSRFRSI